MQDENRWLYIVIKSVRQILNQLLMKHLKRYKMQDH